MQGPFMAPKEISNRELVDILGFPTHFVNVGPWLSECVMMTLGLHSSSRKLSTPASTIGDSNSHFPPTRHGRTPGHINFSRDSRDAGKDKIRNDEISSVTTSNVYILSLINKSDRYLS